MSIQMGSEAIILNGQHFQSKGAATKFFRQMLTKYELGQMVDQGDERLLTQLLARHRHARDLMSRKIAGFRVVKAELYGRGHRRFEIVREDGSVNDFSYLKCISPPGDPHLNDVMWAMRCEVIEQTREFHNATYLGRSTVPCGITGVPVRRKDSHVDHAAPLTFQALVVEFLKVAGLRLEDIAITLEGRFDNCSAKYLRDRQVAAIWQTYHQQYATLRIASKSANLSQKKTKIDFSMVRRSSSRTGR